jgi:hypothetical protein
VRAANRYRRMTESERSDSSVMSAKSFTYERSHCDAFLAENVAFHITYYRA